ncbi:hypothetical protein N7466_010625 [Penicillium verhagenii]|uniref:uncharacterized protein n=1 Tax=Penicillium verhagenii TaxID=1562060 RepID=UPI002544E5AB|nr:uncharacterized protein N7466_010625 [Penicillium verhagenii]KAJ5918633.1 hypothetical protein N7466_010625 [Penicillium verhagenii]
MQNENEKPPDQMTDRQKSFEVNNASSGEPPPGNQMPVRSPTVTRSHLDGLGLDMRASLLQSGTKFQPGNAFSLLKPIPANGSSLPRRASARSASRSPEENVPRPPPVLRKMSSLDYEEGLAIPMPKPRHMKTDSNNCSNTCEDKVERPNTLRKRLASDPISSLAHTTPEPIGFQDSPEGRKRSRFEMIKSKLSFKDLRKEALKDASPAHSNNSSPHEYPNGIPTGSSSSSQGSNLHTKTHPIKKSDILPPIPLQAPPVKPRQPSAKRIPLPSSGTFSSARPTSSLVKPTSQRASLSGSRASSSTITSTIEENENPVVCTSPFPPITHERRRHGVAIPPSIGETPTRLPSFPNTAPVPNYPVTKDSPPNISDLTEREGKVKYLPGSWFDDSYRPISSGNEQKNIPLTAGAYDNNESPIESLPNYLPSFKERLKKSNLPLNETTHDENPKRSRIFVHQLDDILDMIKSIQQRTDTGVAVMSKKIEELCAWVGDQLQNQIESNGDLSRANSDLFSKQCQISREMMKFHLEIRLEIGVMEQRLSDFENRVIDELQNEVRSLTISYGELKLTTEKIIAKHICNDNQSFIHGHMQKNADIEREIAYMKAHQGSSMTFQDNASFVSAGVTPQVSYSSLDSTEPLIYSAVCGPLSSPEEALATPKRHPAALEHTPVPPRNTPTTPKQLQLTPKASTAPRVSTAAMDVAITPIRGQRLPKSDSKVVGMMPRSVSLTGKGIIKGIKDMTSSSPDIKNTKEKSPLAKPKNNDDVKKWNLFSIRTRRRDVSDTASSGGSSNSRFGWPSRGRRSKSNATNPEEIATRSRSSTPPLPAIPRTSFSPRNAEHARSIERIPTPFPHVSQDHKFATHPALRAGSRTENDKSFSSYETATETFENNAEQNVLDGSVSAFAEPRPDLESVNKVRSVRDVTPTVNDRGCVVESVSPDTVVHRCSEDVRKDVHSTDTLQEWDHVSVPDTKSD